jgi:hypothetical protein
MANPNIVSATTIRGKTDVQSVGTTSTSITSNSAASGKVYKVNTLVVSSVGASDAVVTADIYRGSTAYHLAKGLTVPLGSSIAIVAKENPVYLEEGDSIRLSAVSAGSAQGICSYEDIS